MNETTATPPPWIWRLLGLSAVFLLVGTAVTIGLISAGVFDPKPVGVQQGRQVLAPVHVEAEGRTLTWLQEPTMTGDYSVRLTAAYERGERDVGYGLLIGEPAAFLAVAVSPLGYVNIWQETADGKVEDHLPWQPWPHIAPPEVANEIQIDVDDGQVTVHLNRELLWQRNTTVQGGNVGLYGESFGNEATIAFQDLIWFAPPP